MKKCLLLIILLSCFLCCDRIEITSSDNNINVKTNIDSTNINKINLETNILWNFESLYEFLPPFIVRNGFAIVSTKTASGNGRIYCVELATGHWIWQHNLNIPVTSGFVISNEKVYFGTGSPDFPSEGFIYCLDLYKGSLIWKKKLFDTINISPTIVDGVIYVISSSFNNKQSKLHTLSSYNGKILWETNINDILSSNIIYDDKKLYFTCEDTLYCFDIDGNFVWKYLINGKIIGSPLLSNYKVYITSDNDEYICLDALFGQEIWKNKLINSDMPSNQFIGNGYVEDDNLFLTTKTTLWCIDNTTGNVKWFYDTESNINEYNSLIVHNDNIFISSEKELAIIDSSTKTKTAELKLTENIIGPIILFGSYLYILTNGENGGLMKIEIEDTTNKSLYPFNIAQKSSNDDTSSKQSKAKYSFNKEGMIETDIIKYKHNELIWEIDEGVDFITSPVISEGRLFVVSDNETVYCINIFDGTKLWDMPIEDISSVSPIVLGRFIYIITKKGILHKINVTDGIREWEKKLASPETFNKNDIIFYKDQLIISNIDNKVFFIDVISGNIKNKIVLKNKINANPLKESNFVFFADKGGYIASYNLDKSKVEWENLFGGTIYKPSSSYGFSIYVSTIDGELLSIDTFTGQIKWSFSDNFKLFDSPLAYESYICITTNKGIYCLREGMKKDKLQWIYQTDEDIIRNPIIHNNQLFGITSSSTLFCLYLDTGNKKWEKPLNEKTTSQILMQGSQLFASTLNGNIYAINSANGKVMWQIKDKYASFTIPPVISDNRLYTVSKGIKAYYAKHN